MKVVPSLDTVRTRFARLSAGLFVCVAILILVFLKIAPAGIAGRLQLVLARAAFAAAASSVDCADIRSAILGRSVAYCVDLPADYSSSARRYPTLYFLHGLFEDEQSWIDRGGKEILDNLRAQGQIGNFLVVLPNGGKTFYVNALGGNDRFEDFFTQELVPFIDRKYRSIPNRAERGISGSSMGGYGALHLAMRHPDLFGSVAAQSAALVPKIPDPLPSEGRWEFYARVLEGPFGSPLSSAYWEANSPLTLAEHPEKFAGLKIYFDCGDQDRYGFEQGAEMLDKILTEKHFPHEFFLRSGNHGWTYLDQYMKYALLFEWQSFEQDRPRS
jgi:S-formylglutathione hydrolase FrmB